MAHDHRIVEIEHRIQPAETVGFGGERQIVEGGEILDIDPGRPRGGETADHSAIAQLLGGGSQFGPCARRDIGIEARVAEHGLVVIENRGRGVERERQEIAVPVRVIAGHGRQIRLRRKRLVLVPHQFVDRIDRALGRRHGRGRDFVDLHDRRLAARTKREDRRGDGLGVIALVGRHDPVVGLRGVEIGGQLLKLLAEFTRHRVPPLNIGGRKSGRRDDDRDG